LDCNITSVADTIETVISHLALLCARQGIFMKMHRPRVLGCLFRFQYRLRAPRRRRQTPDYEAIVASPDRSDADRQTDKRRQPAKMLAFTGVKTGMKVLDMEAGAGYSTELLARAVGRPASSTRRIRPR
jgi:hypothetical protein